MIRLTPEGKKILGDIASRHGISSDAVETMLNAVIAGGGQQAQFSHPECGGSCQWMRGGMTMVGDMFNNGLKAQVDNICTELSDLIARSPIPAPVGQSQSQYQGAGGGVSLFVPGSGGANWWPSDLGSPSSTGAQNSIRYAYFPQERRLAIDRGAGVEIYDTLDHSIGGFGQQQSGDSSLTFTSQHGLVRVDALPRVLETKPATPETYRAPAQEPSSAPQPAAPAPATPSTETPQEPAFSQTPVPPPVGGGQVPQSAAEIFSLLERLAELKTKGVISEDDFNAKKDDLLSRI